MLLELADTVGSRLLSLIPPQCGQPVLTFTQCQMRACHPSVTEPVCLMVAAGCVVIRGARVLCCVPGHGNLGSCAGKRVVGAHFATRTERAPSAVGATLNYCCPHVWMPVWTVTADPMHFAAAFRLDDNAAEASVFVMVPLALQLRSQLTDVWPALLLPRWQCTAV